MVPDSDAGGSHTDRTDGGTDAGFDEAALYLVVRRAVEDALLGVIGTLLLVGTALVVVVVGASVAVQARNVGGAVLGVGAACFGVYLAASTLGVIPPVRDWR